MSTIELHHQWSFGSGIIVLMTTLINNIFFAIYSKSKCANLENHCYGNCW
jgi:hypothetical protein